MSVTITNYGIDYYTKLLNKRKPFTFARYGDGEFTCMFDPGSGMNCDRHVYDPVLSEQLLTAFSDRCSSDHGYFVGIQNYAIKMDPRVTKFLEKFPKMEYHDSDVFHRASIKKTIFGFFESLRQIPSIFVGPKHLRRAAEYFSAVSFVEISNHNCFHSYPKFKAITDVLLSTWMAPYGVVAICASMPAEVLIHDLYYKHGHKFCLIDFGSLFDPYVGVKSRQYHEIQNFNFGG